jgi:hypothetical protein
MHGSRCYGCGGSKVVLTRRGKAASSYYQELLSRPVEEIEPGDYVYDSVYRKWFRVLRREEQELHCKGIHLVGARSYPCVQSDLVRRHAKYAALQCQETL